LNQARKDQGDIDPLEAELSKIQDKDVTEAMRSAESRKLDIRASLRALEETITMFEKIMFLAVTLHSMEFKGDGLDKQKLRNTCLM
jgi:hypothetical protein